MRIAVVTNAYPPTAQGGAGIIAAELVALWRASGHEVRVWAGQADWVKRNSVLRLFGHLFSDRRPAASLPEILTWEPDVVVTHNLTGVGWGTGRACVEVGVPWVHVLHDIQLFEPSGQLRADRFTAWQRGWSAWRRRVFGQPTLVVSPTVWLLDAHGRRGFSFLNACVIPNPAPESLSPLPIRSESPWLYVGRLSEDKGADFLLEIARRHPQERFVCIGAGPLRRDLEVLSNVRCLGSLSRSDVQKMMCEARGLLMPSRLQENQPTVILEAFSVGLPVVASTRGGIPETLGEGGIAADLDPEAWSRALAEISSRWTFWSERSRARAAFFDRRPVRAQWERIFSEVSALSSRPMSPR